MTQEERRIWLIRALQAEMPQYDDIEVPDGEEGQRLLLRSLMNLRPPVPGPQAFFRVQDAYLAEETRRRGVVDCAGLAPAGGDGRLVLWQGDITRLKADAIVNAANSALLGCFQPCHACIDNVIHTYSGIQLRLACNEIMKAQGHPEPTGTAKITPGFNLPCKYVLHTVGPIISGRPGQADREMLAACYRSCLELAAAHGLQTVAFCCISTGVFRYPQDQAAETAVETVMRFLEQDTPVRQVVFDVFTDTDRLLYQRELEKNGIS